MSLNNLYSLRNNFLVIGLTGRTGGGANEICEFLKTDTNPFKGMKIPNYLHVNEIQKFMISKALLTDDSYTWRKFSVIKYSDVVLLFFFQELSKKVDGNFNNLDFNILRAQFLKIFNNDVVVTRRLGQEEEKDNILKSVFDFLGDHLSILNDLGNLFKLLSSSLDLSEYKGKRLVQHIDFLNRLYFDKYSIFTKRLLQKIDSIDPIARQLFLQDVASNLRKSGRVNIDGEYSLLQETENIFTVAVVINNLIKINRKTSQTTRLLIDSLKNSLEINYFRERYAGFYLIASSRDEKEADAYLKKKIRNMGFDQELIKSHFDKLKLIDEIHYQTKDFKKGEFASPDVENCIQKADYYIYINKIKYSELDEYDSKTYRYLNLEIQILKFLALVEKPGVVTPSAIERSMQLAFSSKYNSGCISRQVGAVITDANYSVKSIGWNEVPQGQTPCSLRSLKELMSGEKPNVYSDFERTGGDYLEKSFKDKIHETLIETYKEEKNFFNNLKGHNCPYCFKEFHNSFEGKENQVHTRSLHAEENAMLQISKFGGQPLLGGILFTTASPCELCSKKAFQLGITKIFYIDPYPGIAKQQILKAGNNKLSNPNLFMFQGAVGRGYFKLYESYMSIKDETYIRTGIRPKASNDKKFKDLKEQFSNKFPDIKEIKNLISYDEILDLIKKGLEK